MGGTTLSQVPNLMSGTAPTLPGGGQFPGMGGSGPGGPYQARPDLGPGIGFGVGLPTPGGQPQIGLPGGPQFNTPGEMPDESLGVLTPEQNNALHLSDMAQTNMGGPGLGDPGLGSPPDNPVAPPVTGFGPGGPYQARPDLGPGIGFGVGLPTQRPEDFVSQEPNNPDFYTPTMENGFQVGRKPTPTPAPMPGNPNDGSQFETEGPNGTIIDTRTGKITGYMSAAGGGQVPPQPNSLFNKLGGGQMVGGPAGRPIMNPPVGGGVKGRDLSGPNPNTTTINSQNRLQQTNGMRPAGTPAPKLNATNPARNQFAPGMPGMPPGGGGRVQQAPRMNDQTMFNQSANARAANQFGNVRGVTPYSNAPTNRYAPPNAPGVRSAPITRPRIR